MSALPIIEPQDSQCVGLFTRKSARVLFKSQQSHSSPRSCGLSAQASSSDVGLDVGLLRGRGGSKGPPCSMPLKEDCLDVWESWLLLFHSHEVLPMRRLVWVTFPHNPPMTSNTQFRQTLGSEGLRTENWNRSHLLKFVPRNPAKPSGCFWL